MDDVSFTALAKAFPKLLQGAHFSTDPLPKPAGKQPPFICGAISHDETMVALSGGGRIPSRPAIWVARIPSFETVAVIRGHQGVHDLAWDPATGLLASASNDYTCAMWDVARQDHLFVTGGNEEPIVKGHVAFANGALFVGETEAFQGLRARLLRASLTDGSITTVCTLDDGMSIERLAISGERWAIAVDDFHYRGKVRLVVANKEQPAAGELHAMAWCGSELAQLVSDSEGLALVIGQKRTRIDAEAPDYRVAFSPDASLVAIGYAGRIRVVDTQTGESRCSSEVGGGKTMVLAWSASLLCAANDAAVAIIDPKSGKVVASTSPPAWFR